MGTIAATVAIRATNKNVAQELHLDFLETSSPAAFALAFARVEAESAGIQPALPRHVRLREDFADIIESANVNRRIGTRRFCEDGLIDEDNPAQKFRTFDE